MPTLPIVPTADAFRFVTLRPAIKKRRIVIDIGFVTFSFFDSISPPVLSSIESIEPLLYSKLKSRIPAVNSRELMEEDVTTFRTTSTFYIPTEKKLSTLFPNFDLLIAIMEDNRNAASINQLKTKVEAALGTTISNYVNNGSRIKVGDK